MAHAADDLVDRHTEHFHGSIVRLFDHMGSTIDYHDADIDALHDESRHPFTFAELGRSLLDLAFKTLLGLGNGLGHCVKGLGKRPQFVAAMIAASYRNIPGSHLSRCAREFLQGEQIPSNQADHRGDNDQREANRDEECARGDFAAASWPAAAGMPTQNSPQGCPPTRIGARNSENTYPSSFFTSRS